MRQFYSVPCQLSEWLPEECVQTEMKMPSNFSLG